MKAVMLIFAITVLLIAASLTVLFGQNKNTAIAGTNDKIIKKEKSVTPDKKAKRASEKILSIKVDKSGESKKSTEKNDKRVLVLEERNKQPKNRVEGKTENNKNIWELIKRTFSFNNEALAISFTTIGSGNIMK